MSLDRRKAIHRQRRIIFNDDGGVLFDPNAHSEKAFLDSRLAHILDTQVDSIWWSFIVGADNLLYDTRVDEIAGKAIVPGMPKADQETWGAMWHTIKTMMERGTDPLKFVTDWGHGVGREVFASFRMNMIQDSWRPYFASRFKREHPEYCLGERGMGTHSDNPDERLCWSALDWEHEAVRDQRLALIDDICSRYDVDGMELDFWRWPILFKPTMYHEPVEQKQIDMMTDFMRKTRQRVTEIETERERPILIAPRVFDTLEVNRRMGLDVEAWLEEGLLDILAVGGHYTYYSIPVAEWAELAHRYDVPLYPCLYRSTGVEFDRAVASHFFNSGADGIYTFNLRLPGHLEPIKEIGDPDLITRKDKHYVMNPSYEGGCLGNGCAPGLLPVRLTEGTPATATLIIGDDVKQAAAEEALALLKLRLSLTRFDPYQDTLSVKLNGRELKHPQPVPTENPWEGRSVGSREWEGYGLRSLEFQVFTLYTDVKQEPYAEQGENKVELTLGERASGLTGPVDLAGLELWVRYQ